MINSHDTQDIECSNVKIIVANEKEGFYGKAFLEKILRHAYPRYEIVWSNDILPTRSNLHILIRGHFSNDRYPSDNIPYITFSGESRAVEPREYPAVANLGTLYCSEPNYFYFPYILDRMWHKNYESVQNIRKYPNIATKTSNSRPFLLDYCASPNIATKTSKSRPFLLGYCARNPVQMREHLFHLIKAKDKTNTTIGLGWCSHTNGFDLPSGDWSNLTDVYKDYRFVIAMENRDAPGYITEKLMNVFISGAIPIYWGNNDTVLRFFNPKAFINVNDFNNLEDVANHVIALDSDPSQFNEMATCCIWANDQVPDLFRIAEQDYVPEEVDRASKVIKLAMDEYRDGLKRYA